MLAHCEWATHELRQQKRDGHNCLSHFCPLSWNQRGHSWILQMSLGAPAVPFYSTQPLAGILSGLSLCSIQLVPFSCDCSHVELPDSHSHVLGASCRRWLDATEWAGAPDAGRPRGGKQLCMFTSHTHTHTSSVHKITVRQPHYGWFARVESVDVGVLSVLAPSGAAWLQCWRSRSAQRSKH